MPNTRALCNPRVTPVGGDSGDVARDLYEYICFIWFFFLQRGRLASHYVCTNTAHYLYIYTSTPYSESSFRTVEKKVYIYIIKI